MVLNERYSRQTLFSSIGKSGQKNLLSSHVLIIGAGALGTSNAEMLVRAGVGKVTIVDRDYVEWSNLQRQQLYTENDANEKLPKAIAAEAHLKKINSELNIKGIVVDISIEELEHLLIENTIDVILDATDNFETRMLINDMSQKFKIPWIYGACTGSYGLSYTILPDKTPCLSCLIGTIPQTGETCDTVGVISPAVQIVTAHQTTEVMKLLVGDNQALRGTLFYFDIWKNEQASIKVNGLKKSDCPSCGDNAEYPYLNIENKTKTAVLCGRDTVQIRPSKMSSPRFEDILHQLEKLEGAIQSNPYLINFTIGEHRLVIFKDGRVLIHGTKDIKEAKSLYNRYIGG